jgi:hypothetical protein
MASLEEPEGKSVKINENGGRVAKGDRWITKGDWWITKADRWITKGSKGRYFETSNPDISDIINEPHKQRNSWHKFSPPNKVSFLVK